MRLILLQFFNYFVCKKMEEMQEYIKKCEPGKARKRLADKTKWKREVLRQKRYESPSFPTFPNCDHNRKAFRCATLTCTEIRKFHQSFYKGLNKISQDNFIIKYCTITKSKTMRVDSKRNYALKYYMRDKSGKMVPVCQQTFARALCVKKDRIQGVMRRFMEKEEMARERRGGDRRSEKFEHKKKAVQAFIESFKATETHYCRAKNLQRVYLPAELNIRKLWRIYNKDHPTLVVKQNFFRKIFVTSYNIGFGTPRTDVCSTCLRLNENIKRETIDLDTKNKLIIEKRIHRLRYKAFYEILAESRNDLMTMSFDCQKNLALPKVPDQSAYYSRQYNFYNFTIVVGNSKAKMTKDTIFAYTWNETAHHKGSNEITSAVHHFLLNFSFGEQKVLRIVADGCSGQNKNTTMIAMLGKWLTTEAPRHLKKVEIIFPVVGHSYIPPDRIFAQIEKSIKKREIISSPDEYQKILGEHCQVTDLESIAVHDWKSAYTSVIKPTPSWHVQFQKCKRFFLTRTRTNNLLLQGEMSYKNDINAKKPITKKNKTINMINSATIAPNQIIPKRAKITDVSKLLEKHYGDWKNMEQLKFYKLVEERTANQQEGVEEESVEMDDLCEAGFEDVNLIV